MCTNIQRLSWLLKIGKSHFKIAYKFSIRITIQKLDEKEENNEMKRISNGYHRMAVGVEIQSLGPQEKIN